MQHVSGANITSTEAGLEAGGFYNRGRLRLPRSRTGEEQLNTYSLSHIVQIMDFFYFLHEYCEENLKLSQNFELILSLVET